MILASACSSADPVANLQLALGVELAVLPPYLYALWSIRPAAEGASVAAVEATASLRNVIYGEMLHIAAVCNVLNSLGTTPDFARYPMRYPSPLPGHVTRGRYAFRVGLASLSARSLDTFLKIERPQFDAPDLPGPHDQPWITLGAFYQSVIDQLKRLPASAFGKGAQMPARENPAPGRLPAVVDAASAALALAVVIDQGEGHKPPKPSAGDADNSFELDDDHEVAHYYQFQTLAGYFAARQIRPATDLFPLVSDPNAQHFSPAQQAANQAFNRRYSELIDSLQASFASPTPTAFGAPSALMRALTHAAAVLRQAGDVPGTRRMAGPTFEYLPTSGRH